MMLSYSCGEESDLWGESVSASVLPRLPSLPASAFAAARISEPSSRTRMASTALGLGRRAIHRFRGLGTLLAHRGPLQIVIA